MLDTETDILYLLFLQNPGENVTANEFLPYFQSANMNIGKE